MSFIELDALVGQKEAKSHFKFISRSSRCELGYVPPLLVTAARGVGKTAISQAFVKSLRTSKGDPRKCLTLNCASIKSVPAFFDRVYPAMMKAGECGIIFDECAALPRELQTLLLTPLNPEKGKRLTVSYRDNDYEFNLMEWAFVFVTTDSQSLIKPLVDRLTPIALKPYSISELGEILKLHLPDTEFGDGVLSDVSSTVRGNARSAVLRAKQIASYCGIKGSDVFDKKDWEKLKHEVNILPLGMDENEAGLLRILARGAATLGTLTAATTQSRSMIQNQIEPALIRMGLMKIETGSLRTITPYGREIHDKLPK